MGTVTMEVQTRDTYHSVSEMQEDNERIGHSWFSRSNKRFFNYKLASRIVFGGHYFISSEQYRAFDDHYEPRLYTVRSCFDGKIDSVGEFQQYKTVEQAKAAARIAARN